jgi:hypothetical protein
VGGALTHRSSLPITLAIIAIDVGIFIGIWENIGVPGYDVLGVVVFLFVYSSLAIGTAAAWDDRQRTTHFLILGTLPLFVLNAIFLVFSDPFHLPPLLIMAIAILIATISNPAQTRQ